MAEAFACWPFDNLANGSQENPSPSNDQTEIERNVVVTKLLGALRKYRSAVLVVVGPGGIGKTTVLGQVHKKIKRSIFVRVDPTEERTDAQALAKVIVSEIQDYPDANVDIRAGDMLLGEAFDCVCRKLRIPLVIIDGIQNLTNGTVDEIVIEARKHEIDLVLSIREKPEFVGISEVLIVPPLSLEEATELAAKLGVHEKNQIDRSYGLSHGNPLRFRSLLRRELAVTIRPLTPTLMPAAQRVVVSGGFIDRVLYAAVSGVNSCHLDELEAEGWLAARMQTSEQKVDQPPPPFSMLAMARAAWWRGNYKECVAYANRARATTVSVSLHQKATLEIGIARFFEGNWKAVEEMLEPLIHSEADLKTLGWARLILGTTKGLLGTDVVGGRELLYSALMLLREESDFAGVAIAYGNLGEIAWKAGLYEDAKIELSECISRANRLGMRVNEVEGKRNLLHLLIRTKGPFDKEVSDLLADLSALSSHQIGKMEMMQLTNTLATARLYRREIEPAKTNIAKAKRLTGGNPEYRIYTLANAACLAVLEKRDEDIRQLASKALEFCIRGKNRLAISQIRHDIQYIGQSIDYLMNAGLQEAFNEAERKLYGDHF